MEDNASDYEEVSAAPFTFRFNTPWSFPVPVFQALATRYPTLTFDCVCIDGSWNFGGEGAFNPREGQPQFRLVDADERLYSKVHGVPPED